MNIQPAMLPCPYCGWSASEVAEFGDRETIGPPGYIPQYAVVCRKCHAQGPLSEQWGPVARLKAQAIHLWNLPQRAKVKP